MGVELTHVEQESRSVSGFEMQTHKSQVMILTKFGQEIDLRLIVKQKANFAVTFFVIAIGIK